MDQNTKEIKLTTKQIGIMTELACQAYFSSIGCNISIPIGDNARYDMIIEYKGLLLKVQVKTASLSTNNAICFFTRSSGINSTGCKNKKYKIGEIDCFATFYDNICYVVPIEEALTSKKSLQLGLPQNGQIKRINFASEYVAEKQLEKIYQKRIAQQGDPFLLLFIYVKIKKRFCFVVIFLHIIVYCKIIISDRFGKYRGKEGY